MPPDESKGNQLDAIGSLAQRQLDNTVVAAVVGTAGRTGWQTVNAEMRL